MHDFEMTHHYNAWYYMFIVDFGNEYNGLLFWGEAVGASKSLFLILCVYTLGSSMQNFEIYYYEIISQC